MSGRKECLIFLCHDTRPGAMAALGKVIGDCTHLDVVPLFDQTHQVFDISHVPGALRVTCADTVTELPYPGKHADHPGTFWPRNIDLPLFWYFNRQPQYEFYWVLEYDVRFTGHWQYFFNHFAASDSDLLITTVFDYAFRPGWMHWRTLRGPEDIPLADRVRATHSFFRISRRALQAVDSAYRAGWCGHYEVAIPTLLKRGGYRLEDIGGDGAYVRPGNHNRFYTNSPHIQGLAPGTFVLREEHRDRVIRPNMLYNPFKG